MFSVFSKTSNKVSIFSQSKALFTVFRNLVNMRDKKSSSSVQALYELCKNTFNPSGTPPPSSQDIQKLCSLMDTIGPADVGLKEEISEDDRGHGFFGLNRFTRQSRWAQPITYIDIHECDSFTMCIFHLPTSSVIPLHDHPGMSVYSRLLYGSMHVKAYDWVDSHVRKSKGPEYSTVRLAKLAVDKVLTAPCATSVLHPKSGGNLHCFTAITPCAVLDVLAPPYRETAGRRCTYYHDFPYTSFSLDNVVEITDGTEEDYAWLAEIETPDDLYMRSGVYAGPAIQV